MRKKGGGLFSFEDPSLFFFGLEFSKKLSKGLLIDSC